MRVANLSFICFSLSNYWNAFLWMLRFHINQYVGKSEGEHQHWKIYAVNKYMLLINLVKFNHLKLLIAEIGRYIENSSYIWPWKIFKNYTLRTWFSLILTIKNLNSHLNVILVCENSLGIYIYHPETKHFITSCWMIKRLLSAWEVYVLYPQLLAN